MTSYFIADGVPSQFHVSGVPASGYFVKAYIAGTSTPAKMYTNDTGTSAGVKITLDPEGWVATSGTRHPIWLDAAIVYDIDFVDTDDSTVLTSFDNISASGGQYYVDGWTNLGDTPTFVSFTAGLLTFTVTGDQTANYPVGRWMKISGSGFSDARGAVASVAFSTVTTITVYIEYGVTPDATINEILVGPTLDQSVGYTHIGYPILAAEVISGAVVVTNAEYYYDDPRRYGAVGDGSTANRTANTSAFQAILDVCKGTGISAIRPRYGEYILNKITYKPTSEHTPLTIIGEGTSRAAEPENNLARHRTRAVILNFDSLSGADIAFEIGDGLVNLHGLHIENMYFLGTTSQNTASPTDTTVGLSLDRCQNYRLINVVTSKFHTGRKIIDSWSSYAENVSGVRCYFPVEFNSASNQMKENQCRYTACYNGPRIIDSDGIDFDKPWLEALTNGLYIDNGANAIQSITINNPHCETITNYCFNLGFNVAGTQSSGTISSVIINGGYYNSVGSGVSNAKVRVSANLDRDLIIIGAPGNFTTDQIVNNYEPVKMIRGGTYANLTNRAVTGPYYDMFIGYKASIADNSATNFLDITVPTGDFHAAVKITATAMISNGSGVGATSGILTIGRKSGGSTYAAWAVTDAKVTANDGGGSDIAGVFTIAESVATNIVTLSVTIDNNQSTTCNMHYVCHVVQGERTAAADRQLAFAEV